MEDMAMSNFDLTPVLTWPNIEVSETDKEVKVRAELCRVSKNKTSRFNFRTASLHPVAISNEPSTSMTPPSRSFAL
jgi:hypothetical protein